MTRCQDTTCDPPDLVPDHADLLGWEGAGAPELNRDADRMYLAQSEASEGTNDQLGQDLSRIGLGDRADAPSYYVSRTSEIRPRRKGQRGRPPKRGRPKAKAPDGRRKALSGPLTAAQRRDIIDAVDYARDLDRPLNTTVDIHPAKLDTPPTDIGRWVTQGPWRSAGEWMNRRKDADGRPVGWYGVVIRENYEGEDREHVHLLCHCRDCDRDEFEAMLDRRHPGAGAVHVGEPDNDALTYRMKQSAGNAMGQPSPGRPVAERRSRHDGAPVTTVLGKRYTVSRSIDLAARTHAGWQQERDHQRQAQRDHYAARRRELADA